MPLSFDPDWQKGSFSWAAATESVTTPAGSPGDNLIGFVARENAGGRGFTPPSGFTTLASISPAVNERLFVVHRLRDGTEGATVGFTFVTSPGGHNVGILLGNFPPGTVDELDEQTDAGLSWALTGDAGDPIAGVVYSDGGFNYNTAPLTVTPPETAAWDPATENILADNHTTIQSMILGFGYEPATPNPTFAILNSAQSASSVWAAAIRGGWTDGRVAWGTRSTGWH